MSPVRLRFLRLLTLDATGTLVKFRKPPFQIYADFGKKHGLQVDEEKIEKSFKRQWTSLNESDPHFGLNWQKWWNKFVVETFRGAGVKDIKILNLLATELIEHFRSGECWELKPGALDFLETMDRKKLQSSRHGFILRLGVVSNFDPRLREILQTLGILQYFDHNVLSHEAQLSKPDPAIFHYTVKTFFKNEGAIHPSMCLHIGDNYKLDYIGATAAGWNGALLVSKEQELDLPHNVPQEVVFRSFKDLSESLFEQF